MDLIKVMWCISAKCHFSLIHLILLLSIFYKIVVEGTMFLLNILPCITLFFIGFWRNGMINNVFSRIIRDKNCKIVIHFCNKSYSICCNDQNKMAAIASKYYNPCSMLQWGCMFYRNVSFFVFSQPSFSLRMLIWQVWHQQPYLVRHAAIQQYYTLGLFLAT